MDKKEKISKMLKEIEGLIHKMIDENKAGPFNSFELLMITMDALIKESQMQSLINTGECKKVGNA